jgi:hypothetical protein
MKKLIILVTALCLLFVLSGCASSNPADVESTTEPGVAADPDITADPAITAPGETAPVEVEVHIGDSLLAAKGSLENIIVEYENAVLWKDSKGYHIACAGEDGDTIYAIISFSEDLELLEAEGLELIDPPQMEEWLGKTEEDFIAQYGPYHFQAASNQISPAFIAKDGNIYLREVENGTIVLMYSYSIDLHHSSHYDIKDLEEPDVFDYEVHIGDSLYTFNRSLESSIDKSRITMDFDYSMWRDSKGYHIACRGEDNQTIYAIVWFSEDLELLEAEGLEPIEPLTQMEEWLGKTKEEFIAQYGPCHFVAGSGISMPSYIAKDGTVFWITTELGTIMSMNSYSIDRHHSSNYSLYS